MCQDRWKFAIFVLKHWKRASGVPMNQSPPYWRGKNGHGKRTVYVWPGGGKDRSKRRKFKELQETVLSEITRGITT
jgi:hypothetical protein